jgi:hypothetical protein
MRPQARHTPVWCSGDSYVCPATCCLGLRPRRSSLLPTKWTTSWARCMISVTTYVNIWRWRVTKWRTATTAWVIPRDSGKGTKSGCITRPGQEERHLSFSHHRKASRRWSPWLAMRPAASSDILGRRLWRYTWTVWQHVWGLLGTGSLKDLAVSRVRSAICNVTRGLEVPPAPCCNLLQVTTTSCTQAPVSLGP